MVLPSPSTLMLAQDLDETTIASFRILSNTLSFCAIKHHKTRLKMKEQSELVGFCNEDAVCFRWRSNQISKDYADEFGASRVKWLSAAHRHTGCSITVRFPAGMYLPTTVRRVKAATHLQLLSKSRQLVVVYTVRYAVMTWCIVQDRNNFTCSQVSTHDDCADCLTNWK